MLFRSIDIEVHCTLQSPAGGLICILLYNLSPVLNPMSYDGTRLYKAPGRPIGGLICQFMQCRSKAMRHADK